MSFCLLSYTVVDELESLRELDNIIKELCKIVFIFMIVEIQISPN